MRGVHVLENIGVIHFPKNVNKQPMTFDVFNVLRGRVHSCLNWHRKLEIRENGYGAMAGRGWSSSGDRKLRDIQFHGAWLDHDIGNRLDSKGFPCIREMNCGANWLIGFQRWRVNRSDSNPRSLVQLVLSNRGIEDLSRSGDTVFHCGSKTFIGGNNLICLSSGAPHFIPLKYGGSKGKKTSASYYSRGEGNNFIGQRRKPPFITKRPLFAEAFIVCGILGVFAGCVLGTHLLLFGERRVGVFMALSALIVTPANF